MLSADLLKQDFSNPFSSAYWKKAVQNLSDVKITTLTAFFIAMYVLFNTTFKIPVGQNLNIMINYIPTALCGMIGGPIVSIFYAIISDILGFFLRPEYGFFPGYTVSTICSGLIFSFFLFGVKHNIFLYLRIILSKTCINIFVNILLNSLWSNILFKKGYVYYLAKSVVKNLTLLPIEIIILCVVISSVFLIFRIKYTPVFKKKKITE